MNSARGSRSSGDAFTSTAARRARCRLTSTRPSGRTSIRGTRADRPGSCGSNRWSVCAPGSPHRLAQTLTRSPSCRAHRRESTPSSAFSFFGPRSHVVVGDFEFPTMAQVWLAQERRGAVIRRARAEADTLPLAAYDAVIDERTLIVPATHVCFRNGHRTDIGGLVRLAHERGAYVFLGDYQRTGSGPIDVHALGVDFMVTGCLKYLLAAAGVAFLYVRRDLIERLEPTITGWFGRVNPFAFRIDEIDWPATATRFETGTPPVPNAYLAIAAL